jgi:hypothetical protein
MFFFFYLFASFSAIFRGFTQVFNMVARKVHQLTMNMHKTLLSSFFFLGSLGNEFWTGENLQQLLFGYIYF